MPAFHTAPDPAAIRSLACQLWGQPTQSTRDELRFGTNGSKSVKPHQGVWFDHEAGVGGHYRDLYRLANGTYPENGSDKSGFRVPDGMLRELGNPVEWWDYHDVAGQVIGRVVRFHPPGMPKDDAGKPSKTFRQCRPDDAGWKWRMDRVALPLYRLPSLLKAAPGSVVYLTEGEKKADELRAWGLTATSNAGGSGKFTEAHARALVGFRVVLLADNDTAGRKHSATARCLLSAAKVEAREIELPGLPPKGDVLDWIKGGGTLAQLEALTAEAWNPTKPPLPLVWLEDIEPVLTSRDFVQGLLIQGALTVVYGDSHAGKTFWTTDLALHVAAGKLWNERRVDQGGVVYCVLEGGDGFRNRISAWRKANRDAGKLPFASIPSALNLLDPNADTNALIATIKAASDRMGRPVKLVVVDTLARALAGGNENAPEDMGALVINADKIRAATGANVLFVHHSGKDAAKGARGHSSLRAAVDTEVEVISSEDAGTRTATVVKQRDLAKIPAIGFRLDTVVLGQNEHGEDVTSCTVEPAKAAGRSGKGHDGPASDAKDQAILLMREIENLIASDAGRNVAPEPGMPICPTVSRKILHPWLVDRGWVLMPESDQELPLGRGTDTFRERIPNSEYVRLKKRLERLKKQGKIGFNRYDVWIPKKPEAA